MRHLGLRSLRTSMCSRDGGASLHVIRGPFSNRGYKKICGFERTSRLPSSETRCEYVRVSSSPTSLSAKVSEEGNRLLLVSSARLTVFWLRMGGWLRNPEIGLCRFHFLPVKRGYRPVLDKSPYRLL